MRGGGSLASAAYSTPSQGGIGGMAKKVKPIPQGFHSITPALTQAQVSYLDFAGSY